MVRVDSIDTTAGTARITIVRETPQATVRVLNGRLDYTATADTVSDVRFDSVAGGAVEVSDSLLLAAADASCSALGDGRFRCANVTSIAATLGNRGDRAVVAAHVPASLEGGEGNDRLTGGPAQDSFDAGPGEDSIVSKDGRVETIACGAGNVDEVAGDAAPGVQMENTSFCEWVHDGGFDVDLPVIHPVAFGADMYSNNNLTRVHAVFTLSGNSVGYRRNSCFVITGEWCALTSLGGYATTAPTVVEAANRTDVVVGGGGGTLYYKGQTCRPNGTCDPWPANWRNISTDQSGTTITTTASPDLARYGTGNYTLLTVRGQNNALWTRMFDGTNWGRWQSAGGTLIGGPGATWVAPPSGQSAGVVEIFGVGTNGALYRNTAQCNGTTCTFSGWVSQGAPTGGRLVGDVDATSRARGAVDIVARDTRGYALHRQRTATTWSPYVQLAHTLPVYGPTITSIGDSRVLGSTSGGYGTYVQFHSQ
jgi:hypothetical protein